MFDITNPLLLITENMVNHYHLIIDNKKVYKSMKNMNKIDDNHYQVRTFTIMCNTSLIIKHY